MKQPKLTPPATAQTAELDTRQLLLSINSRQSKTIWALAGVAIAMGFSIKGLLPLKETVPYVVENNSESGEVRVLPQQALNNFKPTQANVMFFVRRWIRAAFSIQPQLTTSSYQPLALSTLRGKNAIAQYDAFLRTDKALQGVAFDPTMVREVEIQSISPVSGADRAIVANLLLRTTYRGQITEERKFLTLYYEMLPAASATDRETHPIGLYIVDFKLTDAK